MRKLLLAAITFALPNLALATPSLVGPVLHGGDASNVTVQPGSAPSRPLSSIVSDLKQARTIGAICDGSSHPLSAAYGTLGAAQAVFPGATALTEETDLAAINAGLASGGHVQLPDTAGTAGCMVNGSVAFSSNSALFGSGIGISTVTLELATGQTNPTYYGMLIGSVTGTSPTGVSNVRVSGLTLDGGWPANGTNVGPAYPATPADGGGIIVGPTSSHVTIDHVEVKNVWGGEGIGANGADIWVTDNQVHDNWEVGIYGIGYTLGTNPSQFIQPATNVHVLRNALWHNALQNYPAQNGAGGYGGSPSLLTGVGPVYVFHPAGPDSNCTGGGHAHCIGGSDAIAFGPNINDLEVRGNRVYGGDILIFDLGSTVNGSFTSAGSKNVMLSDNELIATPSGGVSSDGFVTNATIAGNHIIGAMDMFSALSGPTVTLSQQQSAFHSSACSDVIGGSTAITIRGNLCSGGTVTPDYTVFPPSLTDSAAQAKPAVNPVAIGVYSYPLTLNGTTTAPSNVTISDNTLWNVVDPNNAGLYSIIDFANVPSALPCNYTIRNNTFLETRGLGTAPFGYSIDLNGTCSTMEATGNTALAGQLGTVNSIPGQTVNLGATTFLPNSNPVVGGTLSVPTVQTNSVIASGSVQTVTVTGGGSYSGTGNYPLARFPAPASGGINATGTPILTASAWSAFAGGTSYTNGATVTIQAPNCTTLPTATVTASGGVVSALTVVTAGSCTSNAGLLPAGGLSVTGGGGSGLLVKGTWAVASITVTNIGSLYASGGSLSFTGTGSPAATATFTVNSTLTLTGSIGGAMMNAIANATDPSNAPAALAALGGIGVGAPISSASMAPEISGTTVGTPSLVTAAALSGMTLNVKYFAKSPDTFCNGTARLMSTDYGSGPYSSGTTTPGTPYGDYPVGSYSSQFPAFSDTLAPTDYQDGVAIQSAILWAASHSYVTLVMPGGQCKINTPIVIPSINGLRWTGAGIGNTVLNFYPLSGTTYAYVSYGAINVGLYGIAQGKFTTSGTAAAGQNQIVINSAGTGGVQTVQVGDVVCEAAACKTSNNIPALDAITATQPNVPTSGKTTITLQSNLVGSGTTNNQTIFIQTPANAPILPGNNVEIDHMSFNGGNTYYPPNSGALPGITPQFVTLGVNAPSLTQVTFPSGTVVENGMTFGAPALPPATVINCTPQSSANPTCTSLTVGFTTPAGWSPANQASATMLAGTGVTLNGGYTKGFDPLITTAAVSQDTGGGGAIILTGSGTPLATAGTKFYVTSTAGLSGGMTLEANANLTPHTTVSSIGSDTGGPYVVLSQGVAAQLTGNATMIANGDGVAGMIQTAAYTGTGSNGQSITLGVGSPMWAIDPTNGNNRLGLDSNIACNNLGEFGAGAPGYDSGGKNCIGSQAITAMSWASTSGGQVTATTTSAHGYVAGDTFVISGVTPSAYNGTYVALSGTTGSTLVYALASNPGTVTVQGNLVYGLYPEDTSGDVLAPGVKNLASTTGQTVVQVPASAIVTIGGMHLQTYTNLIDSNVGTTGFYLHDVEVYGSSEYGVRTDGRKFIIDHLYSHYNWTGDLASGGIATGAVPYWSGDGVEENSRMEDATGYNHTVLNGPNQPLTYAIYPGGAAAGSPGANSNFFRGFDNVELNLMHDHVRLRNMILASQDMVMGDACTAQEISVQGGSCAGSGYDTFTNFVIDAPDNCFTILPGIHDVIANNIRCSGGQQGPRNGTLSFGLTVSTNYTDARIRINGFYDDNDPRDVPIHIVSTGNNVSSPVQGGGITLENFSIVDSGTGQGPGVWIDSTGNNVILRHGKITRDDGNASQLLYPITDRGFPAFPTRKNSLQPVTIDDVTVTPGTLTPAGSSYNQATPTPLNFLAANDLQSFPVMVGTAANLPTAGNTGLIYVETDTSQTMRDNGSAWVSITPTFTTGTAAAAGSGQVAATALTSGSTDVTSGCCGVRALPTGATGQPQFIQNDSGSALNLYPAVGATISGYALNSPYVIPIGGSAIIIYNTATTASVIGGASSGSVTSVNTLTGAVVTEHCQTFASVGSNSWTKDAAATWDYVDLMGAGGGGGQGAAWSSGTASSGGGGGGGGGLVAFSASAAGVSSGTITVGTGGAGSTGGNGGAGGNTTAFQHTAYGGGGGGDGSAGAAAGSGGGAGIGAAGGSATGSTPGAATQGGQAGSTGGPAVEASFGLGGAGGGSGASGVAGSSSNTTNGGATGGGGGGGISSTGTAAAGGAAGYPSNGAATNAGGAVATAGNPGTVSNGGLVGIGGSGGGGNAAGTGGAGGAGINGSGGGGGGAGSSAGGAGGNGGNGYIKICQRATT